MSNGAGIVRFCHELQNLGFATVIRQSAWLFPTLESVHVFGLALVVGSILTVDCRLLGFGYKDRTFSHVAHEMLPWTWCAFALTAVAGVLMFSSKALTYYGNFAFRLKMLCLVLAGLNVAFFHMIGTRYVSTWDRGAAPLPAKLAGATSLLLWVVIVAAGRWVGFTT